MILYNGLHLAVMLDQNLVMHIHHVAVGVDGGFGDARYLQSIILQPLDPDGRRIVEDTGTIPEIEDEGAARCQMRTCCFQIIQQVRLEVW